MPTETSNDRFAIPEPVLLIASERQVTHYPRVIKKKNKGALTRSNNQTRVLLRAQTIKQGYSYELKRIYICGVHLGLLPQNFFGWYLSSISIPIYSVEALALS